MYSILYNLKYNFKRVILDGDAVSNYECKMQLLVIARYKENG